MKRGVVVLLLALSVGRGALAAEAEPEVTDAALLQGATDALVSERPVDAIAKLESLGDRGVVDPVVSFDRGLAYAARIRAGAGQPGDLGRAAHAFEEAKSLTRDPGLARDAALALEVVRAEVARRRARTGDPVAVEHGVSLGRSIVELLPENVWASLALVFALVLSAGIVVRFRAGGPRSRAAGNTTAAVAGGLLVVSTVIAAFARDARLHLREGVVVAESARLLDDRHIAKDGLAAVPEGSRLRILDETAGFTHVALEHADGYLPTSAVLPLAKR